MIIKEELAKVVKDQRECLDLNNLGIKREILKEIDLNVPFAIILSGIRRCGKSTLLKQIMAKLQNFYFVNFDDIRLTKFESEDFQKLDEIFFSLFGKSDYYFFDEIQNVQGWEIFVRTLLDRKKHIILTGSNASLLSKELGTRLTGRHLRIEIFPFSFKEFLVLKQKKPSIESFQEFFYSGGFPEYLIFKKHEILKELLKDILNRDIAIRYDIRNLKILEELALYLLTNIGKEFSYNKLKKIFELGSVNTIISFISYLEESYLFFVIPKFDYSLKKQLLNPKKVYSIDNGLILNNSLSFSEDKGKLLENIVFLNLRRKFRNIYFFQEKKECDFLVKEGTKIKFAFQVCFDLNGDNKEREISGLLEAMNKFDLEEGLILTFNQEDYFNFKNKKILVKPVWKWLLEE